MTLQLGTDTVRARDLAAALRQKRCSVADQAVPMLALTTVAAEQIEVDLVAPSIRDLGYERGAEVAEFIPKALSRGLLECPGEVAIQMCLQSSPKQFSKEHLRIAMAPVLVRNVPLIYTVFRVQGKLWLAVDSALPHTHYGAQCHFVFIQPRAKA